MLNDACHVSMIVVLLLLIDPVVPKEATLRNDNHRNLAIRVPPIYRFHPKDAFEQLIVCVDTDEDDCDDDTNAIQFVGPEVSDPQDNQFRYHATGPVELQGVFWLQGQTIGKSSLLSFAPTRQAEGGIATGDTGRLDTNGYAATIRPRGDHNWAFSGTETMVGFSTWNEILDVVYRLDLRKGTPNAPRKFIFSAEISALLGCLRLAPWKWIWYTFFQWTMELNDDPSNPDRIYYDKSIIWLRRSSFLVGMLKVGAVEGHYNLIQIVDGTGKHMQPAYDEFKRTVRNEYGNRLFFYGLKPERLDDYSC